MDYRFVALSAFDDQEMAVRVFRIRTGGLARGELEGLLLGIVTFDDMMDVAEEETTEDFHKFEPFRKPLSTP